MQTRGGGFYISDTPSDLLAARGEKAVTAQHVGRCLGAAANCGKENSGRSKPLPCNGVAAQNAGEIINRPFSPPPLRGAPSRRETTGETVKTVGDDIRRSSRKIPHPSASPTPSPKEKACGRIMNPPLQGGNDTNCRGRRLDVPMKETADSRGRLSLQGETFKTVGDDLRASRNEGRIP